MRAPDPDTAVRLHLVQPAHTVQAAHAWRQSVRPRRRRYMATLAGLVGVLAGYVLGVVS